MGLKNRLLLGTCVSVLVLGLSACEKKGPVEQLGEEVDEAVDTVKNGGESTANKLDDAADEVSEAAQEIKEDVKDAVK